MYGGGRGREVLTSLASLSETELAEHSLVVTMETPSVKLINDPMLP